MTLSAFSDSLFRALPKRTVSIAPPQGSTKDGEAYRCHCCGVSIGTSEWCYSAAIIRDSILALKNPNSPSAILSIQRSCLHFSYSEFAQIHLWSESCCKRKRLFFLPREACFQRLYLSFTSLGRKSFHLVRVLQKGSHLVEIAPFPLDHTLYSSSLKKL